MYRQFQFEGDIHQTLECVPLAVRRKLDLAGLKISLAGWQTLTRAERLALCHLPVDSASELEVYREVLQAFALRATVPLSPLGPVEASLWSAARVPELVRSRLTDEQWRRLDEEERYAVVKMADPKRTPEKLLVLLGELGLAPARPLPDDAAQCGTPV